MDLFDQNELHHVPFTIQNMTFKHKIFIWLNIPLIVKTLKTWQTIKCMQSDLSMDVLQNASWKNGHGLVCYRRAGGQLQVISSVTGLSPVCLAAQRVDAVQSCSLLADTITVLIGLTP